MCTNCPNPSTALSATSTLSTSAQADSLQCSYTTGAFSWPAISREFTPCSAPSPDCAQSSLQDETTYQWSARSLERKVRAVRHAEPLAPGPVPRHLYTVTGIVTAQRPPGWHISKLSKARANVATCRHALGPVLSAGQQMLQSTQNSTKCELAAAATRRAYPAACIICIALSTHKTQPVSTPAARAPIQLCTPRSAPRSAA